MIYAVRLRPYNKKRGHGMKTYLSYNSRTKYSVGQFGQPSPIKVVTDLDEIRELTEYAQFEMIPFEDRNALDAFIQGEVETKAREGEHVFRPPVTQGPAAKSDAPMLEDVLPDEPDDTPKAAAPVMRNVGRRPPERSANTKQKAKAPKKKGGGKKRK